MATARVIQQGIGKALGKHVFLIMGMPRTGKTTLADFATLSCLAVHVDTDAWEENEVVSFLEQKLRFFLEDTESRILVVTIGRHGRLGEKITSVMRKALPESVPFTSCVCERVLDGVTKP